MKIAVIGHCPNSLKLAESLAQEGAAVSYYGPGTTECSGVTIKAQPVVRFSKSFLYPTEQLPTGQTRLRDLFRVISWQASCSEELQEMPLASELREELAREYEVFEDVDAVFEFTRRPSYVGMGPGGSEVLNEPQLKPFLIHELDDQALERCRATERIVVVGDGRRTRDLLLELKEWASCPKHQLSLVTWRPQALSRFQQDQALQDQLAGLLQQWRERTEQFQRSLREWRDLPEEQRARLTTPEEPVAPLVFYESFTVTSVDRMSNTDELFLTIESPSFRGRKSDIIKILPADVIVNLAPLEQEPGLGVGLRADEPGYYRFSSDLTEQEIFQQMQEVWSDLTKYFTRAHPSE